MARQGITYNEVHAAAESIVGNGEKPTVQRVREALGNTGSPNTILRHLQAWRSTVKPVERTAPELPAEIQTAIVETIERQSASARAAAEEQFIDSQIELELLAEEGERLEQQNDELQQQNNSLTDNSNKLEMLAGERKTAIEQLQADLEKEREQAENARIELAQVINKNESLVEQKDDLKAELATVKALHDGDRATIDDLNVKLAQALNSNEGLQQGASEAKTIIDKLEETLAATTTDKVNAERDRAVFESKFNSSDERIIEYKKRLDEYKSRIDESIIEYQNRIDESKTDYKNRIDKLEITLEKTSADLIEVRKINYEMKLAEKGNDHS